MTTDPLRVGGWKVVEVREGLLKATRSKRTVYLSLENGSCKQCDKLGMVTRTWVHAMGEDQLEEIKNHFGGRND